MVSCPFCDLEFDSKGMMQMHVSRCHMDDAAEANADLTPYRACPPEVQARRFLSDRSNTDRLAYDFDRKVWRFVRAS